MDGILKSFIKAQLPKVLNNLGAITNYIAEHLDSIELLEGEKQAILSFTKSKDGEIIYSVLIVNEDETLCRQLDKERAEVFFKKLIETVLTEAKI